MQSFWTALVAVVGTLGGATVTYIFGRRTAARAESFARREQVRQDRLAAYLSFAEALSAFRWAGYERWHREHDEPNGETARSASVEYYRRFSAAENTLLRVKMLAGDPKVVEFATTAVESTREIRLAEDTERLKQRGEEAAHVADLFVAQAAKEVG